MGRVLERRRRRREARRGVRRGVRIGAPDRSLTRFSGLAAVSELVERLDVIGRLDAAIGPIKTRDRGASGGEVLVGMAAAQLAGEDFLVGLDRHRADTAGQALTPVPGLASTTAAGLARRFCDGQWVAVETGLGDVHAAALDALAVVAPERAKVLTASVTIDLDTTDVEVYGRLKRGVAFNHQGQRVGRPHVAAWAETSTVLAADLGSGRDDPRANAAELLNRALAALPAPARGGEVRLRADAGYFAGQLARAALFAGVGFAIGARRIAPLWRLLDSVPADGWTDAIGMTGAQVAVTEYCPDWWPAKTRLLIRRVQLNLDHGQVSGDPRARRRRTLHPDQRALPLAELADADAVYAYSFIVTDLDVSTGDRAVEVEHWYRHRTQIENLFRDSKLGAALRHLPSGYPQVNRAWMWGGLLAATLCGWLHHLTATHRDGQLIGHGIRGGHAMIATLRHRLIAVPARLVHHAGRLTLRLPPGEDLLAHVLARIRALPEPT
ncbi:MAG: IS1380 family transposase [Pseudonocardiales bacterium]|nr:IS1380 family transposase [Pseudonocardiales bacterium]